MNRGQPSRTLVIGVGNRDRGDDAAGPHVAEQVALRNSENADSLVVEGDLSDLALLWTGYERVVIVDAMVSGEAPGTVVELDALNTKFERPEQLVSSHGIGLSDALQLARLLDRLPAELTLIAIEGESFELFAPITANVARAVDEVVETLSNQLVLEV